MTEIKTISQIRIEGFAALVNALGPGDAIRFIKSYDQGQGDYSIEKCGSPDEDYDTIVVRIKRKNDQL